MSERRTSIWHPGDVWSIPESEPEPLAGGFEKTSASFTLRRLSVCFLQSCSVIERVWTAGGKCTHVRVTGNTEISVCAESRLHVSHLILLMCCAVTSAISLPACLPVPPPRLHIPAYTCQTQTEEACVYVSLSPCMQTSRTQIGSVCPSAVLLH